MSGSAFLPRSRPLRIPDDIAADIELDRIVAYANEQIEGLSRLEHKLPENERACDIDLLKHRFAAFRDGIAGGLHRG